MSSPLASPAAVRLARATGIFVMAAAAGGNLGLSVFLVPRLLESPVPVMLQQWQRMFNAGRATFVSAGLLATLAHVYVYVGMRLGGSGGAARASRLPLVAAALSLSFMPYTLAVLMPTNKKIMARVAEVDAVAAAAAAAAADNTNNQPQEKVFTAEEETSSRYLVDHWGVLNVGRSALMAASAGVALVAAL